MRPVNCDLNEVNYIIILQQWSHKYNSHLPYHHRYSLHNTLYYVIKYAECIQLLLD